MMKPHKVYTIFQEDDGTFPLDDKRLTETELNKLVAITGDAARWIIIKNPCVDLFAEIEDDKFREAVKMYLDGEVSPDDLKSGKHHVTAAWVLNHSRGNDDRIFASPGAIDISKLSEKLLRKFCAGAKLNEADKQEIINQKYLKQ